MDPLKRAGLVVVGNGFFPFARAQVAPLTIVKCVCVGGGGGITGLRIGIFVY